MPLKEDTPKGSFLKRRPDRSPLLWTDGTLQKACRYIEREELLLTLEDIASHDLFVRVLTSDGVTGFVGVVYFDVCHKNKP